MNKNLKCNKDKSAGENSIVFRLFSVINGLVPLILVQQVTNQVNKFAILFHKYRFYQDCRNKSGNDVCWGCGHSVCYQFFKQMYHPGSSANELALKAKDDYKSVLQLGRSMIEMLGVLAIIAVLSVGGIAGYSKALKQWKINKSISEYNYMIQGLLEKSDDFQRNIKKQTDITGTLKPLELVPDNWNVLYRDRQYLADTNGNLVNVFYRPHGTYFEPVTGIIIDFVVGGLTDNKGWKSENFSEEMCFELYKNLVKPLSNVVSTGSVFGSTVYGYWYGDKYCGRQKSCLKYMTLAEMKKICSSCNKKQRCNITVVLE